MSKISIQFYKDHKVPFLSRLYYQKMGVKQY